MTNESHDPRVANWLRRTAPPAADDKLLERIAEGVLATPQRGGWALWLHAASAPVAASLVVVAGLVVLFVFLPTLVSPTPVGPSSTPEPSPTSPSRSVGPSPSGSPDHGEPTPGPSASADAAGQMWSVTAMPNPAAGAYRGGIPMDVAAGGPGYVAVGSATPCCADVSYDDDPWQTAIWTSTDGVEWELVPELDTFGRSGLSAIASDDDGLMVSVGYEVLPPEDAADSTGFQLDGAIWRSENGIDWIEVNGVNGQFHDVVSTPSGWLVAGEMDGRPVIWTTPDLDVWTPMTLEGFGLVDLLSLGENGSVVAAGCASQTEGRACPAAAWATADGSSWERADVTASRFSALASWNGQFVLAGEAQTWTSVDGVDWQPGAEFAEASASVNRFAVLDDSLLAAGGAVDDVIQPKIWRSTDGLEWRSFGELTAVEDQVDGQIRVVLVTPDRLIALGEAFVSPEEPGAGGAGPYAWWTERQPE